MLSAQDNELLCRVGADIRTRRKLLDCVRAFKAGAPAPGANRPELYRMRSGGVVVPTGVNGLDAMADPTVRSAAAGRVPHGVLPRWSHGAAAVCPGLVRLCELPSA